MTQVEKMDQKRKLALESVRFSDVSLQSQTSAYVDVEFMPANRMGKSFATEENTLLADLGCVETVESALNVKS